MNIVTIAQTIGTVSLLVLFCLKFWISIDPRSSMRLLRIAIFWFSIWVFFFFLLRVISQLHLASMNALIVISGFTLPIPLLAVIVTMWLDRKVDSINKEVNGKNASKS